MVGKAPAGGMTSAVNGNWYEGGQFTPDHGKCCGKGKNRVTAARFDQVRALVEADGKVLVYDEKWGDFRVKWQTDLVVLHAANLETIARCFRQAATGK
jgi:hypothetical protein